MFGIFRKTQKTETQQTETQPAKKNFAQPKKRFFQAGTNSATNANWAVFNQSSNAELQYALGTIRAKSRNLANNDAFINKYLGILSKNVVGPNGFKFQCRARDLSGSYDTIANELIEKNFNEWSKKGNCDVTSKYSLTDLLGVSVKTLARDGEIFIRKVKKFNNDYKFALQLIEADYVDENLFNKEKNISMGIQTDNYGKPINYYVLKGNPADSLTSSTREYHIVPANEMIHLMVSDRPEQYRGVPFITPAIELIKNLNGYLEAEVIGARISASKMGFFTKSEGAGEYTGDYEEDGEIINEVEPGALEIIPEGYNFQSFNPTSDTHFDEFTTTTLRAIASALKISYATLTGDMTKANYSSARVSMLDERDFYKELQNLIIETVLHPVYSDWLEMCFLTNKINLPITKIDKFKAVDFIPRSFAWIDPQKDMKAAETSLKNGLSTHSQLLAERGQDFEETMTKIAQERQKMQELGIDFDYLVKKDPNHQQQPENQK
jgi:lambda family phage portal protein